MWKDLRAARSEQQLEIYGNQKDWLNRKFSVEFLRYRIGARNAMDIPVLLLWDDFSGHWTDEVIAFAKSVLMKVPKSATSVMHRRRDDHGSLSMAKRAKKISEEGIEPSISSV
ncbi:hypothetical protein V7S43_018406 [Phytophthora oleae]|uniref:DDE-1 domain-containing protein n=1 Tax=Phytophthora oleae TaxID=2107226 RepID=A0ABD3EQM5_9STRA